MSRDQDGQQRRWLSLGYGGKTSAVNTWRYWPVSNEKSNWVISAPDNLAEFEQRGKVVFYKGEKILEGSTQWRATWAALGHFYSEILPNLPVPPLDLERSTNGEA